MTTESVPVEPQVVSQAEQLAFIDAQLAPQDVPESSVFVKAAKFAATGVVAVGGAVILHKTGIDTAVLDHDFTPAVPVYEQLTTGIIAANDAIREAAPLAVVGSGAAVYASHRRAKRSLSGKIKHEFAGAEYSGLENVGISDEKKTLWSRARRATVGIALAATAGALITGSAAIEQEVSNGPTRAITHLIDSLSEDGQEVSVVSQSENSHFMNRSYVHVSLLNAIADEAQQRDANIQVTYFSEDLSDITYADGSRTTGILVGMPAKKLFGENVDISGYTCDSEIPVVADKAVGAEIDDILTLDGGMRVRVVGETEESSSMNRSGILMANEAVTLCYQDQLGVEDPTLFGAVVSGASAETMNEIIASVGVNHDAVAISEDRLIANNEKFWRANGTPILLMQIMYLTGFAGVAMAGARLAALQQNTRELGALVGLGAKEAQMKAIESMRSIRRNLKALPFALPAAYGLAAAVNATERGLQVGVSLRDATVAGAVLIASSVFGARRGVSRFFKKTDPAEATAR